jgi:hypothetical protein
LTAPAANVRQLRRMLADATRVLGADVPVGEDETERRAAVVRHVSSMVLFDCFDALNQLHDAAEERAVRGADLTDDEASPVHSKPISGIMLFIALSFQFQRGSSRLNCHVRVVKDTYLQTSVA